MLEREHIVPDAGNRQVPEYVLVLEWQLMRRRDEKGREGKVGKEGEKKAARYPCWLSLLELGVNILQRALHPRELKLLQNHGLALFPHGGDHSFVLIGQDKQRRRHDNPQPVKLKIPRVWVQPHGQ